MNEIIYKFYEILCVKLTSIDKNMRALKVKIDGKAQTAEQDTRVTWTASRNASRTIYETRSRKSRHSEVG